MIVAYGPEQQYATVPIVDLFGSHRIWISRFPEYSGLTDGTHDDECSY